MDWIEIQLLRAFFSDPSTLLQTVYQTKIYLDNFVNKKNNYFWGGFRGSLLLIFPKKPLNLFWVLRGRGQKVVGFTFYGDVISNQSKSRGYMKGIKEKLDLMSKYYPVWVMLVYRDLDRKHPALLKDLCHGACSK